jgi:hypothetical protein
MLTEYELCLLATRASTNQPYLSNGQVPAYKNDFEDWDVSQFTALSYPRIPQGLLICLLVLLAAVVVAVIAQIRRRKRSVMSVVVSGDAVNYTMIN